MAKSFKKKPSKTKKGFAEKPKDSSANSCPIWIFSNVDNGGIFAFDPNREELERIRKKHLEDSTDSIFSFALNNKVRVIGVHDGVELQVVWYDANHDFAESNKKHT